jgi:hypothetical protein
MTQPVKRAVNSFLRLMITLFAIGIMESRVLSAEAVSSAANASLKAVAPTLAKPPERQPPNFQSKVSFSGLKLQGQLKKPDLSYIYKRRGLKAEQIVNIPEDFNEEIVQGASRF